MSLTPPQMRANHLREVAIVFLRLGFTAFGGPAAHIAMMRHEMVERRRWLEDQRFLDLLAIVNLIPGPNSTELAIYLGYTRAGWPGLLLGGVCFIAPAMLIVLALAWAYVTFGALPQVGWLLYGVQPVVIAIVVQALWGLARTALRRPQPVIAALALLGVSLLGITPLVVVFGGGALYGLLRLAQRRLAPPALADPAAPDTGASRAAPTNTGAAPMAGAAGGAFAALAAPKSLGVLFLTFLKIGAVLYGSGYVLLAFLHDDFVTTLHWLTDRQLLDAVSIGQVTPGPVFTTATFIGYIVGGWPGALLATLAIFLPSFLFVGLIHPLAGALRRSPITSALLDGFNLAALALMASATIILSRAALRDPLTWALAIASLLILLRFKLNSVWLIAAGALIGVASKSFGFS